MLGSSRGRNLVILAWAVLVVALLGVREVNPPDEPRFIEQAKEMRDSDDWLVPRIGGVPIPDKPPMLFWGINFFSLPFARITEAAARIPSALAALVVLLLTARLGRKGWGSAAVGNGAALILVTGVEFFQKAQWVSCDMLLAAWVMVTIACWREAAFEGAGGRRKVLLGWLAVAGGILSKGPLSLLWPVFWIVAEALARKSWRPLVRVFSPEGPIAMLLAVGAWLFAVSQRVGWDYIANAIFTQSVSRYTHAWNSVAPWYFYFGQLPLDLLPWSLFLPAVGTLTVAAYRRPSADPGSRAARTCIVYVAFAFLFFSGSTGKRGVYLLPAFPALALLTSAAFLGSAEPWGRSKRLRTAPLWCMTALGTLLAVAVPVLVRRNALRGGPTVLAKLGSVEVAGLVLGGVALAVGSFAALRRVRQGRFEEGLTAAAGGLALLLVLAGSIGGIAWNRYQGGSDYGKTVADLVPPEARLVIDRRKFELILFYSDREGTEVETDAQLVEEIVSGRCQYAIVKQERFEALGNKPPLAEMERLNVSRLGGETYHLLGPGRWSSFPAAPPPRGSD